MSFHPFGDRSILMSDLNSQYIDFLTAYSRLLHGSGGSFFYTWEAGLGMSFIPLFAYYLSSPFNLLLILFPVNNVSDAVWLISGLKIACCGLTFAAYLKTHYQVNDFRLVLFSLFYAFSGYMTGYLFNLMWLDAVVLLPLLCLFADHLVYSRKWIGFSIVLFISFAANFYTAWMTGVFVFIYFLYRMIEQWHCVTDQKSAIQVGVGKRNASRIGLFFLSTGLSAGLSAFLLVPTYFALKNNMGLMGQTIPDAGFLFDLKDLPQKLFIGTFDGIKDCLPHIYSGVLPLLFLPSYFFNPSIPLRKRICSLLIILFLAVSFWFEPLNFAWHAFDQPSWFPFRYAFLLTFVLLSCGYHGWIASEDKKMLMGFLSAVMMLLCLLLIYWVFSAEIFTSKIVQVNTVFILGYTALFFGSIWSRDWTKRTVSFFSISLYTLCLIEVMTNAVLTFQSNKSAYAPYQELQDTVSKYQTRVNALNPPPHDFYRIEKTTFRTSNDAMTLGFPGISHFSSTASYPQSQFLKRLGFDCFATDCRYKGSDAFSDSFLRIRYIMTEKVPHPNDEPVMEDAWENLDSFPLFFFADESFAYVDYAAEVSPLVRQDEMLRQLGKTDEHFFSKAVLTASNFVNLKLREKNSEGNIYEKIQPDQDAWTVYTVPTGKNGADVLFFPQLSLNYDVFIAGEQVFVSGRDVTPFLINLELYDDQPNVMVRVALGNETIYQDKVIAYTFDNKRFRKLAAEINRTAPVMKRTGYSQFTLQIEPEDSDRLLVSSIPFDAGWKIVSEAGPLPLRTIFEGLLGVTVPAGTRELTISFRPYRWEEGCFISLVSLAVFFVLSIFCGKKMSQKPGLQ